MAKDIIQNTLQANIRGVIDLTGRIIPLLNENGKIINVSSVKGSLEH